jgi:histidinol dehydrogenase
MKIQQLFEIALKYIEKGYSYENLSRGDDLYNASKEEKEQCLSYYEDIQEQGTDWAYSKVKSFSKTKIKTMEISDKELNEIKENIKIGSKYKYYSNIYEIKVFVDDWIVFRENDTRISTMPALLFQDLIDINKAFLIS